MMPVIPVEPCCPPRLSWMVNSTHTLIVACAPGSPMSSTPVLFVHGLWMHAASWNSWLEHFRAAGYQATAASWPGDPDTIEEARANPRLMAGYGIEEIVEHHKRQIGALESRPIVIGHSFGGLIAQRLLAEDFAVGAVAIDPAPIKGVLRLPFSSLKVAFPVLKKPSNQHRALVLSREQFRYGFGNAITAAESERLWAQWVVAGSGKPLFEAAFANVSLASPAKVNTKNADRGPLLLIAGGQDHTAPAAVTRATRRLYRKSTARTELREFPDRGHSLTLDSGWPEIADTTLDWLRENSL